MDPTLANKDTKSVALHSDSPLVLANAQDPPSSAETPKLYPKNLLPPSLSSVAPHGPINKPTRSAGEQAALDKRVSEILQSMATSSSGADGPRASSGGGRGARASGTGPAQDTTSAVLQMIKEAYSGQAVTVNEHLKRKRRRTEQLDAQLAQLRDEHEMEVRVIRASLRQQQEERERKGSGNSGAASVTDAASKKVSEAAVQNRPALNSESAGTPAGANKAAIDVKPDATSDKLVATTTTPTTSTKSSHNGTSEKEAAQDEDDQEEGEIAATD